jgi:hypothetical protein
MKKFSEFLEGRCWPGYKPKPGKKAFSPGSCMKESAAAAVAAAIAISKKKSGNYDKEGFRKTAYKNPDHPNRKSNTERESELKEDLRKWFSKTDPKGGWKRINSKGEAIGPCAREPGEPKPKCMSQAQRASLSKKERASAVRRKRQQDPNAERQGAPINVKSKVNENMENLDEKNVPTSPEKWAQAKSQAKAKFDVYPSAYANGWAAKKYKAMGGGWKSVSEESEVVQEGRPSQRHPLEGHEYHKKSNEALIHIAKDAHKAAEAMKSHNTTAENKYRDQANDSATVRYFRQKNGMPEWYKKKYGHIKEAKDEQEYGYEGDMALNQLATLTRCAEMIKDLLKPDTDMPEWVQSKITLATDYIQTAADYMYSEMKEEVEPIEELSKDTLKSYIPAAARDLSKKGINAGIEAKSGKPGVTKEYGDHFEKRYKGIIKATRKLTKESKEDEPHEIVHKDTGKIVSTHKNFKDAYSAYQDLSKASDHAIGHIPKKTNEEVEAITELSSETLDSYKEKAKKSSDSLTSQGKYRQANDRTMNVMKATGKQINKTVASIRKALNRESVINEVMDEPNYSLSIQARQKKADVSKKNDAVTPAHSSLKQTPKKLETPVYESRQMQIVREAMADAKKKDAAKKKEQKVSPAGNDKFQSEPELTSSITKNT